MLWFVLTTGACNLQCRYCGGSFDERHSPWRPKVAAGEVARFIAQRDGKPVVFFYGGEPLLNPHYVVEVMEALPNARFGIQTNGTLVRRLPPEVWRRFSTVLLSIDGPQEVTDYYRGPGVYRRVVEALRWLKDEVGCGCKTVARMAVGRRSDIYRDVTHLLGLGFDAVHWQLNVIWTDEWGPREFLRWAEESYLPGVRGLRDLFLSEAERGRALEVIPILGIYRALLVRPYDWVPCGAGRHAFAINTDGRILHCPIAVSEKWATAGHIRIGLNGAAPRLRDRCLVCEYRHVCGGRCLYTQYEDYWGEEGFDAVCQVTKRTIKILEEEAPRLRKLIDAGVLDPRRLDYDPLLDSTEVIP
ncbi:TIGR04084 family radical SAM/SPASM domain-containing protein [Pyrobaculum neutrophilum]|uniref:Radical SAM domain protein n=1 Tax=Pyrobaculum neutrophilum (strain DSM 2338 / JCM 9278 / NBRC 100436 / V24Sta) TaxID=444157 RepID=B1YB88_PYRNV|nr:TIGR04084 family radical SAM/SPASM domain-containing protein [Pyrobaculum neutrophilum]ACB39219.1 Radical SAM domain protein [Pyrobaculum neutrophilum V24Sta]